MFLVLIIKAVDFALTVMEIAILIRVLSSWIPMDKNNKFFEYLYMITEPMMAPVRNLMNRSALFQSNMGMDFSPIIVFLLIGVIKRFLLMIM